MNAPHAIVDHQVVKHFHLFCGLGGGAAGFQRGHARVGRLEARFRCVGGIDSDPAAIRDFDRLVGVPGTVLDLFDAEQYRDWHGHAPPADWRAATALDVLRAAGGEHPDIVFTSPPCKGFSGLLNPRAASTAKYQALNRLTVRGVALTLEAFADDPPAFFILENVPRIQQRGRQLVDDIVTVLQCHGYAVAETVHDCGEIGGLGQTRKRFLLVARHREKVPPFLYEPPSLGLRTVGDVIGEIPTPNTPGMAMHRIPRLEWQTWVRLALIPAGKDWRALQDLRVVDGHLADIGIAPIAADLHNGVLGVRPWDRQARTVTGESLPNNGANSVADPRRQEGRFNNTFRVARFDEVGPTVTGGMGPTAGGLAVSDPRCGSLGEHANKMRVEDFDAPAHVVTGSDRVGSGAMSVADPRCGTSHEGKGKYRVSALDEPAGAVIAQSTTGNGAFAVADPRPTRALGSYQPYGVRPWDEAAGTVTGTFGEPGAGPYSVADPRPKAWTEGRESFRTGGHYGIVAWDQTSGTIVGKAKHDTGPFSVADVRLPAPKDRFSDVLIVSLDGTWHRPFTTLENAALQGFPWQALAFGGGLWGEADARHRERIGNAVPPPAAAAVASVMGRALLAARAGISFELSAEPVWVQPFATAVSVDLEVPRG